jgi:hypothetical protein
MAVMILTPAAVQNSGCHSVSTSTKCVNPHAMMKVPNATSIPLNGRPPSARRTIASNVIGIVM